MKCSQTKAPRVFLRYFCDEISPAGTIWRQVNSSACSNSYDNKPQKLHGGKYNACVTKHRWLHIQRAQENSRILKNFEFDHSKLVASVALSSSYYPLNQLAFPGYSSCHIYVYIYMCITIRSKKNRQKAAQIWEAKLQGQEAWEQSLNTGDYDYKQLNKSNPLINRFSNLKSISIVHRSYPISCPVYIVANIPSTDIHPNSKNVTM